MEGDSWYEGVARDDQWFFLVLGAILILFIIFSNQ